MLNQVKFKDTTAFSDNLVICGELSMFHYPLSLENEVCSVPENLNDIDVQELEGFKHADSCVVVGNIARLSLVIFSLFLTQM